VKEHLHELVMQALLDVRRKQQVELPETPEFAIERTRQKEHGDFATNAALVLCKQLGMQAARAGAGDRRSPAAVAPCRSGVDRRPGFINFTLSKSCLLGTLKRVLERGAEYGSAEVDENEHITVEFVSANPTGPLHVGHGRGAAFGASLTNILEAAGLKVQREFYVNDYGRQMDILAASVWLRYLELDGSTRCASRTTATRAITSVDVARTLRSTHMATASVRTRTKSPTGCRGREPGRRQGSACRRPDRARAAAARRRFRRDLQARAGHPARHHPRRPAPVQRALRQLLLRALAGRVGFVQARDRAADAPRHMYEQDGAKWFRATAFGDEKDRVVRENGATTYFASDIGYLLSKFERGFERAMYVLGADHHGYIARLKAAASGLGWNPAGSRSCWCSSPSCSAAASGCRCRPAPGSFVTLRDLRTEVGTDAARFFYVMRSNDQHLDFDLELAKSAEQRQPGLLRPVRACACLRTDAAGWPRSTGASTAPAPTRRAPCSPTRRKTSCWAS
jgi:arginyl-tRNA synthetase